MPKRVVVEVPDWVDERDVRSVVEKYVELMLPDSVSREEYVKLSGVRVEDIIELPMDEELKALRKLREKAKERCQF